ncbi:MAG: FeoB-associated Cys-rich membrane protein [Paludibacteraceae bacterium]|nr:FeoB-associated Cys-rich membrane protein [Paludibacteraceae bacterium]
MAYTQTVGSMSQYTQIIGVVQTTQSIHNEVESAASKQEAQTSQSSEANAIMQAASIKDNNHSTKVDSNMKEDLQMLQLAAIIESGQRASANGYTNTVGYTKPVGYTNPVGGGYAPLIGTTSTELETEAALEAGLLQEPAKERTPINQPFTHSPQQPVIQDQPQGKKSLLDRIKANPVVFAVVAAILAFIGYRVYKAKKG